MWDPDRYLTFAGQRARPFADLLAQVPATDVDEVADLGCGPGTLTVGLAQHWPGAHVVGVDSSAEMIAATPTSPPDGVEFVHADLRDWTPERPVDVLLSNATLQWVPGHLDLLPRLAGFVADGGWLAFQLPGNFAEPAHAQLRDLAADERWPALHDLTWPSSHDPATYLDALLDLGLAADVWETTYVQLLQGDDAVLEWMSGTALRPVFAALDDAARAAFVAEYRDRLRAAYPPGRYGTVLPYRRIFAAGHKIAR
ncbi:methyltransferase domain-containing protein [Jiangella aurantiaca]|uniref:Methyltransferase domain-containing protein n=1 Tax=Jiangella aurantiaca TaxID=2530373 RepID=A0A4R5AEG8_9ACTN|nr:methyltransferase domain-containing protein [Jiangella aurantiaca]TDD70913.1 methyltransferase domain-containing protein [Jiangella aurantiaca]